MCLLARLADGPARRQARQRQHGGDGALGLGDGGQLGLDLRRAQSIAGRAAAGAGAFVAATAAGAVTTVGLTAGMLAAIARRSTGGAV